MDGTKLVTDTIDHLRMCGKQAFYEGRNILARECGPHRNENPGVSRIIAVLESLPLKGQGFLDNANQSRVS